MPVDRSLGEDLARTLVDLYGSAEQRLVADLARMLAAGIDRPDWAERRLAQISRVRQLAERIVARLDGDLAEQVEQMLVLAYTRGGEAALDELGRAAGVSRQELAEIRRELPGSAAIQRLVWSLTSTLRGTHLRILRWPLDAYRQVVATAAVDTLLGTATRLRTAQVAWERLLARGITGFVDRSGRSWELASYVEMATRTTVAQAAVEGHLDRLAAAGLDLVIVSNAPQECSLCLVPGTVVEGPAPTGRTRSEYTGDIVSITTASGKHLTGTPDHPVLTPLGWRRLKDLHPGDEVISHSGEQRYAGVMPDDVQVPALIEVARESRAPLLLAGPTRRHFDSDRAYREVRAVVPDGYLLPELDTALGEPLSNLLFVLGIGAGSPLLGLDDALPALGSQRNAAGSGMSRVKHLGALLGGGGLPSLTHAGAHHGGSLLMGQPGHVVDDGLMARAGLHTGAAQVVADHPTADAEGGAQLLRALTGQIAGDEFAGLLLGQLPEADAATDGFDAVAGEDGSGPRVADVENGHELMKRLAGTVAADEVVRVDVRRYSGHVWDLTTDQGWFVANGIVTHNCRPWEGKVLARSGSAGLREAPHATQDRTIRVDVRGTVDEAIRAGLMHPNCRHSLSAYLPGVTRAPRNTADPEGDAARQELRRLERQVRHWKRREAGALTPEAKAKAAAKVRDYQRQIREHVAETGLIRQRHREQIGTAR